MTYILGIDTGGTYTDGVLVDSISKKVCYKAKSLTTKENLAKGIENCLAQLLISDPNDIDMVCLSTTLATNAVVEGKGCDVGLISIGKKPVGYVPAKDVYFVNGLCSIKGLVEEDLDERAVVSAYEHMSGLVDSIVISGYASTRNPEHELRAKYIIQQISNIPVICAHEITGSLGFYDRTVTAVLNAKLVPVIRELIEHIKTVLKEKGINAPIMVVRGNGNFMTAESAVDKPIETILSGPAASIIGASHLSNIKDAIILDIGGTTSDIARIKDGNVSLNKSGATVGEWKTQVNAAEIYTYGIGGDSHLHISPIKFGPEKVMPICQYYYECSCTMIKEDELREIICEDTSSIGFTPTDLAHVMGIYNKWNSHAAEKALKIIADIMGVSFIECIVMLKLKFFNMIKDALHNGESVEKSSIIAIGAPSNAWMPLISDYLDTEIIVPEHAEVANAIGAAVGHIEEKLETLIRYDSALGVFVCFMGFERKESDSLEVAKDYVVTRAKEVLKERMTGAMKTDYQILESVEDIYCESYDGKESIYIETRINVIAVGTPDCIKEKG